MMVQQQRIRPRAAIDEEARAHLQARLMVLSSSMFWSFAAFIFFLSLLYWQYPDLEPRWNKVIFGSATVGLIQLAFIWRVLLARRRLSVSALHGIDAFYASGTGLLFGLGGYLATDFEPAPYMTLLYVCLTVLTRAIVVPSTPQRTVTLSLIAFGPFVAAAIAMALTKRMTLPGSALVAGALLVSFVVTLLARSGSKTTYGLRQSVRAATQLGQYTLDRKIGEGGMGAVHIAHHALLRRPTAIKLLPPGKVGDEALARFEQEVQQMATLSHPNTVVVFDYGRSADGIFYYAMEYLDGIDLEKLVHKYGKQSPRRTAHILAQVCGALEEAHARGLVHRDIKPHNIILCERGGMPDVAKVVDFGLVKQITADTGMSGQILGTPAYIAPEAVTGESVGPPADIYSLGAVGFHLLMGRRLFDGKTSVELCVQHVTASPPPIDAPAALATLIASCLAKSPATRPTATTLARELRELALDDDWDEARARAWWSDFRDRSAPHAIGGDTTLTITVDLAHRSEGA
jgi:serine/threonine-protein kinase